MPGYRIISSDNHVFEPADLWTTRAEPKFRDRVPHIVRQADGDWWYCDNHRVIGMGAGAQTGMRFGQSDQLRRTTTFDHVRPGGYIPEEHVKDMDADGVDVSIVYPTVGLLLYSVPDSDLLTAIFRTYNDWLAEFCNAFPDRLKGIATLNVDDVPSAVKELERCAKMGLAGGLITVYPPEGRGYNLPRVRTPVGRGRGPGDTPWPPHRHQSARRRPGIWRWGAGRSREFRLPRQRGPLGPHVPCPHGLQRGV